jgi:hypothetical protein
MGDAAAKGGIGIKVRRRFEMFSIDFQRAATAAIGALVLTFVTVGAAVGPARVAETSPVAVAQSQVADRANV